MASGNTHTRPQLRPIWHWQRFFAVLLVVASWIAVSQTALAAGEVLRVRTGEHPDTTRLVIDITERSDWQIEVAPDGRSLVIRIDDARMATFVADTVLRGMIVAVETESLPAMQGVIVRARLDRPAHIERHFVLDAYISSPIRLVVDLKAGHVPQVSETAEPAEPAEPVAVVQSVAPVVSNAPREPEDAGIEASTAVDSQAPGIPSQPSGFAAPSPPPPPPPAPSLARGSSDYETDFSGSIEAEGRLFTERSAHPGPSRQTASIAIESKLDIYWNDGDSILTIAPFARLDAADSQRSHFDIREFKWVGVFDPFELRIGIDKAFWGVTESAHLVDIINQDDQLEDIDSEDKLGQPMVALTVDTGFGFLTGYALPYFRERAFPGYRGRPAGPLMVDADQAIFQGGDNNWTSDWAVRWSHSVGALDLALSYFSGLSRDPRLALGLNQSGGPVLVPVYDQIDQVGAEVQGTFGAMLVKFEAIRQWSDFQDYTALAGGFEYTFYGLGGGASDFGVLAEYLYDSRGRFGPSPIEKDLFVGFRWSANDVSSTTILAGAIFDLNESTTLINIEASRRLGDNWKITLDARLFPQIDPWDPLYFISDDGFIQLRLARYF